MAEHMARVFHEMGLQVQWQEVEEGRPNVLGTWRGHRRRQDADVQRPHGHVVLGPRAVARRQGLPAGGVRRGRPDLRARDLEHEGRARLLRRGGARAPGRRRAAARRRADRGRLSARSRRRSGATSSGRGVPRLRGRLALSRHARRRRGHVHPRRADRGQGRARPLRLDLAADLDARAPSSTRRSARGSSDQNSILRMREVLDAVLEWIPDWETTRRTRTAARRRSSTSVGLQAGFGWRVSRTPHRTDLFLDVRVPPTKPMAVARREVLDRVRCAAGAVPRLRDRLARST